MRINGLSRLGLIALVVSAAAFQACKAAGETYVQWTDSPGSFPIVNGETVASIYVGANEWPGVARAARDLRDDIKRVSGNEPILVTALDKSSGKHPILIGTLGHSPLIDQLANDGKIDASAIHGKWESFMIQVVPHALGVPKARW